MESLEILYEREWPVVPGHKNAWKTRVHAETHVNMNGNGPGNYLHAEHT